MRLLNQSVSGRTITNLGRVGAITQVPGVNWRAGYTWLMFWFELRGRYFRLGQQRVLLKVWRFEMARGVNKAIVVGNLGKDPETRFMPNGNAVCEITVATSENWKDRDGNQQERTEWHRIVAYGRLAEIMGEYLRKGRQVYIEGRIQTEKWQDKEGRDRYTTKIIANEMQMLGGRDSMGGSGGESSFGGGRPAQSQQAPQSASQAASQSAPASAQPVDDFDDDIPF